MNYRSGRGYKQSRCLNRATKSQSTHVTFLTVFVFCLFFVTVDATAAHVFTSGRLFCIFFFYEKYYTCLLYNISNRSMYCTYLTVHSIFVLCLGPDEMKLFFLVQICCSAVSVKQNRIQHTQPYEQLQRDAFGQINPLVDTHTRILFYFFIFICFFKVPLPACFEVRNSVADCQANSVNHLLCSATAHLVFSGFKPSLRSDLSQPSAPSLPN